MRKDELKSHHHIRFIFFLRPVIQPFGCEVLNNIKGNWLGFFIKGSVL